jgi:hypothetical protein
MPGYVMALPSYQTAHKHAFLNREELLASTSCGCFYCLRIFPPGEIVEWIDTRNDIDMTALCPYCGIDSVIGAASGYPITQTFLKAMHQHWF